MNYNSIEEIFAAGVSNMTAIRNNIKNDDSTDTATGVDWFTFNGTPATTIYINGNSWLGFGKNSEQLKVNRRDGAVYSIYREEGTLYDFYKFLKIRWFGYSTYSQTADSYALTYDVILWDTGDISLHMVSIPTASNTGVYALVADNTYSYSVSNSAPDVTFTKTETGFTVSNNIIALVKPLQRYLVRSGTTYYTVVANALTELNTTNLTSETFLNSGTEEIPALSLLTSLSNPELLYWTDKEAGILQQGLIVTGLPSTQVVYYEPKNLPEDQGLAKVYVFAQNALFAVSADNGQTWKYHNGINWVLTGSDVEGMSALELKNLTATHWTELITSGTFQFRVVLQETSSSASKLYYEFTPIE